MRDPLDLCFQPALTLTPYVTPDDGCHVRHRFVAGNSGQIGSISLGRQVLSKNGASGL